MSNLTVTPHANNFGARIEGVQLQTPLSEDLVKEIKDIFAEMFEIPVRAHERVWGRV